MSRTITLILLLASGVYAQIPAADWRFAHPDAAVRASINIRTLMKSPTIAALKDQAPKENQVQIGMALAMLSSIDRISISLAPPADKTAAGASVDPDVLVLVTGSFDAAFLQSMLPPGGPPQIKQVDPHTVLFGNAASFAQAIQRASGAPLSTAADELERSDVWLWADLNQLNKLPDTNLQMEGLRSFSLGLNTGENVDLTLIAAAADAAGAQKLLETFNFLMKQSGMPADASATIAKALDMRVDGSKLRVHFTPPPEMIKAAQQQAGGPGGSLSPDSFQPLLKMLGLGGPASAPAKSADK